MITCSAATSACAGGHGRDERGRPPPRSWEDRERAVRRLERRLRGLEQCWNEYKHRRSASAGPASSSASCHRRGPRSDTGTPSSAVVVAAADATAPGGILGLGLRVRECSPRKLVSSLQDSGGTSSGGSTVSAGVDAVKDDEEEKQEDAASSVCSVDADMAMATSSRSCSCDCAVHRRAYGGYSSSSSCSAAAPSFPPVEEAAVIASEPTKTEPEERRAVRTTVGWLAVTAIGVVLTTVLGVMAMAILELAMDGGPVEFLVPT